MALVWVVTSGSVANAEVFLRKWGSSGTGDGQGTPNSVAVQGDEVYVLDTDNYRVQVFDRSGTFLRKWGSFGRGDGQFDGLGPGGVAVQGDEVYVTDLGNDRRTVLPCRATRCT